ncbi:multiheme c-type cytochrome [Stygiobacter electus]|uniref:Cytochrome c3 family protein n=1 Tax=Stygiobacter electus TaxID=3032292 RepID=A0AAE3P029_9BACT|nr:multiheme c-type cytochrome [Stygiobacter electus]MDF1611824.1 cytochrome c3 family protein [Stygiobacter electus]
MFRKLTTLCISLLFTATLFAQTPVKLSINVYGVSPRDVAKSTTDIYTYPSTGLNNVGVGSLMYFKVAEKGKKFGTAVTYTITRKPSGSTAKVGDAKDIQNDSTQVVTFTPDKPGAYEITVTDGAYSSTITINAAKYLGYTNTVVNGVDTKVSCKTCHSTKVAEYENTHHASMFTRAMNGTPGLSGPTDHYSVNCIGCHTTGFDKNPTAVNDGFDDLTFTYPTTLAAGTYDKLVQQFPEAMKRANIQCESCHGPASGHLGATTDSRMVATYDPAPCAYCHDSGTRHIFPEQWDASKHAGATSYPSGAGRESCVRCHTGAGFAQFTEGIPSTDPYYDVSYSPITCAGCHDPHNDANAKQLRRTEADLLIADGKTRKITYNEAGTGAVCMNCHQSRAEANAALAASITIRFGPHYGPQGDILFANNMLELGGQKLYSTNHKGYTKDACVSCHMLGLANPVDAQGNVIKVGGHTFSVETPDGKDNLAVCTQCHGSTFQSFADAKLFINGYGDWDNDGIVEGLQDEVWGMIRKIMDELGKIPGTTFSTEYGQYDANGKFLPFPVPKSTWTKDQLSAYWNAITAHNDKSGGIHNPKYVVTGLIGAMKLLKLTTDIKQDNVSLPVSYELYQNYPNPFNPTTNIKFALPKSGNVKLVVYDITGKEVTTLVNNYLNAGQYTFEFNAKNLASGIYLYRIETDNFVKVNKMILMK